MGARLVLVAALLILQACIREQGPPSERFKKGGSARSRAWKELEKDFRAALDSTPKTREGLSAVAVQWLGPSEPTALYECRAMLNGPGMDGPVRDDVLVYLLERDADGFSRYLVVDYRKPEQVAVYGVASTGPPSKKNDPHDRISDVEKAVAKEIDAIPINLGGGSEDGSYKSGYRIWIQAGQGSAELLQKAATLSTLVCVDLEGPQVTDDWLAPLDGHPYIGSMTLKSPAITDKSLTFLRRSTGLKWLTLDHCAVTAEGVRALQTALPKCEITIRSK